MTAVRRSGLKVSKPKLLAVFKAFAAASVEEYEEQQHRICDAYNSKKNTRVAIDTSYSQGRNAQFSQTAALESESGEIIQMVVLDKHKESCNSNMLEVLGVEKLIDRSLDAGVPLAVISTDECGSLGSMLNRKSKIQGEKFGIDITLQNDPFHKLKNSKKARKSKFQDQKIESQKLVTKLENLERAALIEIAT